MDTDVKQWFTRRVRSNSIDGYVPTDTIIKLANQSVDIIKTELKEKAIESVKATICDRLCSFRSTPCTADCGMIQAFVNDLNVRIEDKDESIIVENYEILLSDYKGKAPKGNSWEINGTWYYDYEAAMSIEFPDGFRLPTTIEWIDICNILDNDANEIQSKLKLELNGYYNRESLCCIDTWGFYWSGTYYDTYYAYLMYFYSGYINPQLAYNKDNGFTVRGIKLINE